MKALEALEHIAFARKDVVEIVRKELKDYEYLYSYFIKLKDKYGIDDLDYLEHICRNYDKKSKALEVIKNILKDSNNLSMTIIELPHINSITYEVKLCDKVYYVEKEDFDLLKEVLND